MKDLKMKNLIKKLKIYECEYETSSLGIIFLKDCYLKEDIDNILNQHNIITAPKSIKLSEIVSRLEKIYTGCEAKIVVEKKKEHIILWCKTTLNKHFILEINMNNNNIKGLDTIVAMNEECFMNSLKWLYALWIAGTEIIDDIEE